MRKQELSTKKNPTSIPELGKLLEVKASMESIANWMMKKGSLYTIHSIKQTFKKAKRDDLLEYFIQEADIKMGDTIKSRFTSRVGTVIGIHADGDTITVKWEGGGKQFLSKESVWIVGEKDPEKPSDITKAKSIYDSYGDIEK